MSALIPSASSCHLLKMPPIEKDDRLNLYVRTGSASTLYRSFVFAYGGLTIGLELENSILIGEIQRTFLTKVAGNKSRRFSRYLSGELFFLDLISKVWSRVVIPVGAPKPKPRLFHELATGNNCLYLFGGLKISQESLDDDSFELMPCNDLWEFNFIRKSWSLLHDGASYTTDSKVPSPRYSHKLTGLSHLAFARKKAHSGLMIAGGHDQNSHPIYTNCVFDLVDKCYVDCGPPLSIPTMNIDGKPTDYFQTRSDEEYLNINYLNSIIVNFNEEVEHVNIQSRPSRAIMKTTVVNEESIFMYVPTISMQSDEVLSPLLVAKIGKKIKRPKPALLHRKRNLRSKSVIDKLLRRTVPHNLRYPTGGVFGQNLVIIGFLPNDFDISIFVYNKPTGKWMRLNIFCHHDYGSHRFWGGFVWTSHHKVVLLGNYVTSRTTSSVRYFSSLITVSLPVTNILASAEMAKLKQRQILLSNPDSSSSDPDLATSGEEASSSSVSQVSDLEEGISSRPGAATSTKADAPPYPAHKPATFSDYVQYAAPKVKFTKIRSVFPPAAITLGRNSFDRYGNFISDFEFVSLNGDRIPVCMSILMARWGKFFIDLLAKAYVKAVDSFETDQIQMQKFEHKLPSKINSNGSSTEVTPGHKSRFSSYEPSLVSENEIKDPFSLRMEAIKSSQKEVPQFRLPFQDKPSAETNITLDLGSIDPHKQFSKRCSSSTSNVSEISFVIPHLNDIPPQKPMPQESVPDVPVAPTSFRSTSRKSSTEAVSPRASLFHSFHVPRNIFPLQSPKESLSSDNLSTDSSNSLEDARLTDPKDPFTKISSVSSRAMSIDEEKRLITKAVLAETSKIVLCSKQLRTEAYLNLEERSLLDFSEIDFSSYTMKPSLIPRKLYVPFSTTSLKAFAEYLYTGEVGNKWIFRPCALDCLWMARYYKVQLLYDLLCEVLYGIIGRKEVTVITEGKKYRCKFDELLQKINPSIKSKFKFPLDEYEGFLDTVDDGYMDIALLRRSSNANKSFSSSRSGRRGSSFSLSKVQESEAGSFERNDQQLAETKWTVEAVDDDNCTSTSTSVSDEDAPPLHFLDHEKKSSLPSVRYKSVFDKGVYDTVYPSNCFENSDQDDQKDNLAGITLENLVSMDSPEPSDYVIDLIYEMASVCGDVKLMLRSMNARQMSLALAQTKEECSALRKHVEKEMNKKEDAEVLNQDVDQSTLFSKNPFGDEEKSILSKQASFTGSISPLKLSSKPAKQRDNLGRGSSTLESEMKKKKTGGPSGMTSSKLISDKKQAIGSVDQNKKLDKQISQLIRKEERLRVKAVKEEMLKQQLERADKNQSDYIHPDHRPTSNPFFSSDKDSLLEYTHLAEQPKILMRTNSSLSENYPSAVPEISRHRFLGRFVRKTKHITGDDYNKVHTAPQLMRTDSSTSVISTTSKKSNNSKKSGGSVKGFFGLRNK